MRIEAIIFDVDNTLYDERQYVRSGFRAVSEYMAETLELNKDQLFRMLMSTFLKRGRGEVFNIVLEELSIKNEETVQKMLNVYRNHPPIIKVFKDTKPILHKLRKRHRLGIITDGVKRVQEIKIGALNIAGFFDVITYAVEYGGKDNNDVFLATLEKLKTTPSHTIYVDDNPTNAFSVAKELGIHTVRMIKGEYGNTVPANEESKPAFEVRNLKVIPGIVRYLESN